VQNNKITRIRRAGLKVLVLLKNVARHDWNHFYLHTVLQNLLWLKSRAAQNVDPKFVAQIYSDFFKIFQFPQNKNGPLFKVTKLPGDTGFLTCISLLAGKDNCTHQELLKNTRHPRPHLFLCQIFQGALMSSKTFRRTQLLSKIELQAVNFLEMCLRRKQLLWFFLVSGFSGFLGFLWFSTFYIYTCG